VDIDMGIKIIKYLNIFQSNTPSALLMWTIRTYTGKSCNFLDELVLVSFIKLQKLQWFAEFYPGF
jgi:hypothetical protein